MDATQVLKISECKFGCFNVRVICSECGKINKKYDFAWDTHHIGVGDIKGIRNFISEDMATKEHICCIKCGEVLKIDDATA